MKTTKCKMCNVYPAVLVADRARPSTYAEIAPQSDSDKDNRFIHVHPFYNLDHCYYCTKKVKGRIKDQRAYGFSYDGRRI